MWVISSAFTILAITATQTQALRIKYLLQNACDQAGDGTYDGRPYQYDDLTVTYVRHFNPALIQLPTTPGY